jgi:hypothetical protein
MRSLVVAAFAAALFAPGPVRAHHVGCAGKPRCRPPTYPGLEGRRSIQRKASDSYSKPQTNDRAEPA